MKDYTHILLATDFSADSAQVSDQAIEIARHYGAKLSIVHVVEYVSLEISDDSALPQELDVEKTLKEIAQTRMQELAGRLDMPVVEQRILQGSTRREILRMASEVGVDLIVIGSHGRHGLQLLLGSTANAVLHGAPCDVLAVRIQDRSETAQPV